MGFKGFDKVSDLGYQQSIFTCKKCDNQCDVTKIKTEDMNMFYGDRCEIYSGENFGASSLSIKNPFEIREEILMSYKSQEKSGSVSLGIPRVGLFYDMFPLWSGFLDSLGLNVVVSDKTNKKIISEGLEKTTSDFCFPFKVASGHFSNLEGKVDFIFSPDITESYRSRYSENGVEKETNWDRSRTCPYLQNLGPISAKNSSKTPLINPVFSLRNKDSLIVLGLHKSFKDAGFKFTKRDIKQAYGIGKKNYLEFKSRVKNKGNDLLQEFNDKDRGIVIIGRPYSAFDDEMNLRLAGKILKYGFLPIPMDFLPLPKQDLSAKWINEFSAQGQLILNSANVIKELGLNSIVLDYFGCGPNSFIKHFFSREVGKPFLTLQIDEHTASAGLVTRLEAFLDSIEGGLK